MGNFERELHEKFQDFEVQPPHDIWDAIEARLETKKSLVLLPWLKAAAVISLLIISAASLVYMLPTNQFAESLDGLNIETGEHIEPIEPSVLRSTLLEETSLESASYKRSEESVIIADLTMLEKVELDVYPALFTTQEIQPLHYSLTITDLPSPEYNRSSFYQNLKETFTTERTFDILAQTPTQKESEGRFAFSAYLIPQQSYRYHRSTLSFPFESLESEIFTFAAGFGLSYKISNRWEIEGGIGYNLIGQAVNDIAVFSHPSMIPLYSTKGENIGSHPQSMSTSMGGINFQNQSFYYADLSSSRIFTLKGSYDENNINLLNKSSSGLIQHLGYLELPFVIRYKIIDRMISMYVKSGLSANLLLTNNVYLQGSAFTQSIGENTGLKPFNWSGMAGLAFSYPLSNRINLSMEPTVNMFLTPIGEFRNMNAETYPYNFSLNLGVKYNLR
ncbi:MAG: PorT family protein [Bacteroidetes bacterium]|nr:MAG: PorT family protein [Bacteroidota bacterium]